ETKKLQSGAKFAQPWARAFAEDAINVAKACILLHNGLDGLHCLRGELHSSVAAGVSQTLEAQFWLLGRDDSRRQAETLVLAAAKRVETGCADVDEGAVTNERHVLEQRTNDGWFAAVAPTVIVGNLRTEQEQSGELPREKLVVGLNGTARRQF